MSVGQTLSAAPSAAPARNIPTGPKKISKKATSAKKPSGSGNFNTWDLIKACIKEGGRSGASRVFITRQAQKKVADPTALARVRSVVNRVLKKRVDSGELLMKGQTFKLTPKATAAPKPAKKKPAVKAKKPSAKKTRKPSAKKPAGSKKTTVRKPAAGAKKPAGAKPKKPTTAKKAGEAKKPSAAKKPATKKPAGKKPAAK